MLEATSVAGCGSSPVTLSTKAIFAEFPILYTCSYNIKVWSSNEIGRSRDGSLLHLQQQGMLIALACNTIILTSLALIQVRDTCCSGFVVVETL